MSPRAFYLLVALIFLGLGTWALWFMFDNSATFMGVLGPYLGAINVIAFGFYGHDKMMAQHHGRRVPELVLHALAVLGGSLGAFVGMQVFRHKTVKGGFRIVFWVVVLQLVVIAEILRRHFLVSAG